MNNGWNNNQFNKLLNESENVYGNQPVKRWARLVEAEKVLMKDQGTIPLVQVAKPQLLKTTVKEFLLTLQAFHTILRMLELGR